MRLYLIDQLLQENGLVSFARLQEELQCSGPTVKRDLKYLREELGAPLLYSRAQNGYYYSHEVKNPNGRLSKNQPEVPAAWYSPEEIYVLLSVYGMFERLEKEPANLLAGDMRPLKSRMLSMIRADKIGVKELLKRVKVLAPMYKLAPMPCFSVVGQGLSLRRRVRITYFTRGRSAENAREISPLRLVNYRQRWYVEAWCHTSEALKTFAVENIRSAELLTKKCKIVSMKDVEENFDSTYGIFSGANQQMAQIRIDELMSPYVSTEIWHEKQQIEMHPDGTMTLTVPFAKEVEIASRIIALGRHAKVLAPETLQNYVRQELTAARELYNEVEEKHHEPE